MASGYVSNVEPTGCADGPDVGEMERERVMERESDWETEESLLILRFVA